MTANAQTQSTKLSSCDEGRGQEAVHQQHENDSYQRAVPPRTVSNVRGLTRFLARASKPPPAKWSDTDAPRQEST